VPRKRRWLVPLATVLLTLAGCGAAGKDAGRSGAARHVTVREATLPREPVIGLAIAQSPKPTPIPRSFLGLSTEYWTLPVDERHVALYGRVISLLHVPGDGPFVLRVGGDSSDHTFYAPHVKQVPPWVFDLTPGFIARTVNVVRKLHLRVILDLNLVTAVPKLLIAGVEEAQKVMPPGSVMGYEIGNEPDLYNRAFWSQVTRSHRPRVVVLPQAITARSYADDYDAYSRAFAHVAPRASLFAPALASPEWNLSWVRTLLAGPHRGLHEITAHRYPYSACVPRSSEQYPTIDRVLSERATAGMAQSVKPLVAVARSAGLPVRLTEINSVTCGGLAGVSDTFATSLWAPDALFELARAGVKAVDLHARVYAINDPFTFYSRGLVVRPLLYGLILFVRTLGPDARLVPLNLSGAGSLPFKAWAVEVAGGRLHVLLIDKGSRSIRVRLALPASAPANLERMLAPSVRSRTGETLAGQSLAQNAKWSGRRRVQWIVPRTGQYPVTLSPYSAALLSVQLPA
jgi:hypothetical protein